MRIMRFSARLLLLASIPSSPSVYAFPHHIKDGVHKPVRLREAVFKPFTDDLVFIGKDRDNQSLDANHATVEFALDGTLADCKEPHTDGTPCQIDYALEFIQRARKSLSAGQHLNVITFIHGNDNWASDDADNYPHFRQLIDCLNLGGERYQERYHKYFDPKDPAYNTKPAVLTCEKIPEPTENLFAGIFIGWRGNANASEVNISERSARRISMNPTLVDTLYRLRDATKSNDPATNGRFVVYAHSFGGLMLEQSAIRIYEKALPLATSYGTCDNSAQKGLMPFTDMMVAIAPAVDAVPAKTLIEDFQRKGAENFCTSQAAAPSMFRPLMISLVSKHDGWSFANGGWLRHAFGGEGHFDHPPRKFEFDSDDIEEYSTKPKLVAKKMVATLNFFQNLCDLSSAANLDDEKEPVCNREKPLLVPNRIPGSAGLTFPAAKDLPADSPLHHLYVRFNCSLSPAPPGSGYTPPLCHTQEPYSHYSDLHVWNRTPYWIGAVDVDVYSGHNGFWQPAFVQLLASMAKMFPILAPQQVLPDPK